MTTELIAIIGTGLALAAFIQRQGARQGKNIETQSAQLKEQIVSLDTKSDQNYQNLDVKIDQQSQEIIALVKQVATLQGSIETFFRIRVDQPSSEPIPQDKIA